MVFSHGIAPGTDPRSPRIVARRSVSRRRYISLPRVYIDALLAARGEEASYIERERGYISRGLAYINLSPKYIDEIPVYITTEHLYIV
jgi:hypothetical protein